MDAGDYDRALDLLEKLLKKNPGDAEAQRLLDELRALKDSKSGDGAVQDELSRSTAEARRAQKELEELIARGSNSTSPQNAAPGSVQRAGERTSSAETSSDKIAAQQKLRDAEEAARRAREAEIAAEKAAADATARERKAEAEKAAQALAAQKQREAAARKAA
ncbi:MAG: tetratricopeptide repeat protein, partial [Treponema socranskii subsp. buccale]